jgi:hypothetical protein
VDDVLAKIPRLIGARYPILWLVTPEEERLERGLERVAQQNELQLLRWRRTTGLVGNGGIGFPDTDRAYDAIDAIDSLTHPALFVFEDIGPEFDDPMVVRRLRDLSRTVAERRQAILIVSHRLHIPPELEKDIAVLDVPLPGRAEVARLLGLLLLSQKIELPADLIEQFVTSSLGLTEKEIKRAYARILIDGKRFAPSDLDLLLEEKAHVLRKSRYLEFVRPDVRVRDVGGLENLKEWLKQRAAAFT